MRLIYWNHEQITPPGSTVRTVSSLSLRLGKFLKNIEIVISLTKKIII